MQTSVEALKQIVDEEDQEAAEGEEEVFPDHLKFVVDVAVRGGVAHEPRATSAAESEDYVGSLLSILGFCDESTAHDVLSLLKQTARSVTEYADTLDRVLTHDDETPDLQLARQLLALLWVQKTSAHDLIAGLQQGGSIQALLESGLAHDSASTRARAYNCVVQAGMNAAPDSASVDAAVALLCRAACHCARQQLDAHRVSDTRNSSVFLTHTFNATAAGGGDCELVGRISRDTSSGEHKFKLKGVVTRALR